VATPQVWKGKPRSVKIGRPEAIVVAVPSGSAGKMNAQVSRPDPLVAPFAKGQAVGSLKVVLGDQPLAEVPLVALDGVEQAGFWAAPGMPSACGSSDPTVALAKEQAHGAAPKLRHACLLCAPDTLEGFSEFPKGFTFSLFHV
jgi:hypothetical protein